MTRRQRSLGRDRRGTTIIEFAIIAPVMMIVLMGLGDLIHQVYIQSVLDGALQKAARDSTIQGANEQAGVIDDLVLTRVREVARTATGQVRRESYTDYGSIKPERIYDTNGNDRWDTNECFDDSNGNRQWDAYPGRSGTGGASDVVRYTMSLTYTRLFPVASMFGMPATQTLVSRTVMKNQPWTRQRAASTAVVQVCPA